jgi:hypothetical protein
MTQSLVCVHDVNGIAFSDADVTAWPAVRQGDHRPLVIDVSAVGRRQVAKVRVHDVSS